MKFKKSKFNLFKLKKLVLNEKGQGTTEYIILIIFVALVLIPFAKLLPKAVLGYVRPFYYCLSRAIP